MTNKVVRLKWLLTRQVKIEVRRWELEVEFAAKLDEVNKKLVRQKGVATKLREQLRESGNKKHDKG